MEFFIIGQVEEIVRNRLLLLFSTPKYSVPYDRDFGVDFAEIVDYPVSIARIKLLEQCIDQVNKYEPDYRVLDIEIASYKGQGKYIAKVVIERAS